MVAMDDELFMRSSSALTRALQREAARANGRRGARARGIPDVAGARGGACRTLHPEAAAFLAQSRSPGSRIVLLAAPSHAVAGAVVSSRFVPGHSGGGRAGLGRRGRGHLTRTGFPCGSSCRSAGPEAIVRGSSPTTIFPRARALREMTDPGRTDFSPAGRRPRAHLRTTGPFASRRARWRRDNFTHRHLSPHEAVALSPEMDDAGPVQPGPITWRRYWEVEDRFLPRPRRPGRPVVRVPSVRRARLDRQRDGGLLRSSERSPQTSRG